MANVSEAFGLFVVQYSTVQHSRSFFLKDEGGGEEATLVLSRAHNINEGCVCVCFLPISFWTSSSLDVPAGVTQEEGHTGFFIHLLSAVHALIFLARRIQPFVSLVDREVEFCVLTI